MRRSQKSFHYLPINQTVRWRDHWTIKKREIRHNKKQRKFSDKVSDNDRFITIRIFHIMLNTMRRSQKSFFYLPINQTVSWRDHWTIQEREIRHNKKQRKFSEGV